jgi:hypothetical protein
MAYTFPVTSPISIKQSNRLTILYPDSMREQMDVFLIVIERFLVGPYSVTMDPPNTESGKSYQLPKGAL